MNNTARRPKITVSADGQALVSQAGALLLAEAAQVTGLGEALTAELVRWRAPRALHDLGKIIADLVMALALDGNCLGKPTSQCCAPSLSRPARSRRSGRVPAG